jgi:hypothetical protein
MNTNRSKMLLTFTLALALLLSAGPVIRAAPAMTAHWSGLAVSNNNAIALYQFEGDANDAIGSHHGSLHGNASFAPGYLNQALQVDGNGSYVRLGNIHQNPPRDLSQGAIEMWVNLAENPDGPLAIMAASSTDYGGNQDHGLFLGKHTAFSDNNVVFMTWAPLSGGWQPAISDVHLDDFVGQWRHVRGTWGLRGVEIWVDGAVRGTHSYSGGMTNPNYETILIGTNSWQWDMAGLIDEVRIFDIQVLPPAITSAGNTAFDAGSAASFTVTTIGTPQPAISLSGTLPGGVSFNDNGDGTATLAGTPDSGSGGVYELTITAANGAWPDATQTFTLTVSEEPAFTNYLPLIVR